MRKITPCLWFDDNAEEAVKFYTTVFKGSKIRGTTHYGEAASKAARRPKGSVMTILFDIEGQSFLALNGGPMFQFSPAISLMVGCETQLELDELWSKLSADPASEQCGWLKDKFGVSWQLVPTLLEKMTTNQDERKVDAVMAALLPMKKLDLRTLEEAYRRA